MKTNMTIIMTTIVHLEDLMIGEVQIVVDVIKMNGAKETSMTMKLQKMIIRQRVATEKHRSKKGETMIVDMTTEKMRRQETTSVETKTVGLIIAGMIAITIKRMIGLITEKKMRIVMGKRRGMTIERKKTEETTIGEATKDETTTEEVMREETMKEEVTIEEMTREEMMIEGILIEGRMREGMTIEEGNMKTG